MISFAYEEHSKRRAALEAFERDIREKYRLSDITSKPTVLQCPYLPIATAEIETRIIDDLLAGLRFWIVDERNKQELAAMGPRQPFLPPMPTPAAPEAPTQAPTPEVLVTPATPEVPDAAPAKVRKQKNTTRKVRKNGGA